MDRTTQRMTLGRMQNPVRGFLHGGAAVAALAGTVYLISRTWGNTVALIGSLVFGFALLVMYTVSTLYHSIPWSTDWKRRLQRVDHSMIYLVVAGTFTPIALAGLDGPSLWICLSLIWGIATVGIVLKLVRSKVSTGLSVTLQLVMGWTVNTVARSAASGNDSMKNCGYWNTYASRASEKVTP